MGQANVMANTPTGPTSGVTFLRSSMMSQGSQTASIADYPYFSGKAKDWIAFERKFRSVASPQGFDHVLQ